MQALQVSFRRLRSRRPTTTKREAVACPQDEGSTAKASSERPTVSKADLENATASEPVLPERRKLTRMRHALTLIYETLDEVDNAIVDILQETNKQSDKPNSSGSSTAADDPLAMSIDLHLADLQRSSSVLCKLVAKYRPIEPRESENPSCTTHAGVDGDLQALGQDSQGHDGHRAKGSADEYFGNPLSPSFMDPATPEDGRKYWLPAPDFTMSSFGPPSPVGDDTSILPEEVSREFDVSGSPLHLRRQRHTSSPTRSPIRIAPLKLPARARRLSSTPATAPPLHVDRARGRTCSSPFEHELGYLERQISETSGLRRRQPTTPNRLHPTIPEVPVLRSVRSSEVTRQSVSSSPSNTRFSAWDPSEMYGGGSVLGRVSSAPRGGLESIGEADTGTPDARPYGGQLRRHHSRHFSTEEKTRRLRARRRGSAPPGINFNSDEPLKMEELIDFLREGNSIRDL
ncbi:hypothetical protein VPNG_09668 [Cytospora leucostoma]|uniref:Uncharacterized protein n=1 Tax=Cytospora leucostoma TaxID=1230097 RepID=A0A423VMR8_9PEZI|nr:hypothetical protein VPNG_09668 [Cytospora leucostoma]